MNLMYLQNKQWVSLVVPIEAVRGLRFQQGKWIIYVSDPEPMAVSVFRLTDETMKRAAASVPWGVAGGVPRSGGKPNVSPS